MNEFQTVAVEHFLFITEVLTSPLDNPHHTPGLMCRWFMDTGIVFQWILDSMILLDASHFVVQLICLR